MALKRLIKRKKPVARKKVIPVQKKAALKKLAVKKKTIRKTTASKALPKKVIVKKKSIVKKVVPEKKSPLIKKIVTQPILLPKAKKDIVLTAEGWRRLLKTLRNKAKKPVGV